MAVGIPVDQIILLPPRSGHRKHHFHPKNTPQILPLNHLTHYHPKRGSEGHRKLRRDVFAPPPLCPSVRLPGCRGAGSGDEDEGVARLPPQQQQRRIFVGRTVIFPYCAVFSSSAPLSKKATLHTGKDRGEAHPPVVFKWVALNLSNNDAYFLPKHNDAKIFENHINTIMFH